LNSVIPGHPSRRSPASTRSAIRTAICVRDFDIAGGDYLCERWNFEGQKRTAARLEADRRLLRMLRELMPGLGPRRPGQQIERVRQHGQNHGEVLTDGFRAAGQVDDQGLAAHPTHGP
jgi:hypothetical protein